MEETQAAIQAWESGRSTERGGWGPRAGAMALSLALAGFMIIGLVAVVSATPTAEEVALTGCLLGCDLNRDQDGRFVLSDYDAREIWHIDPAGGVYTTYHVDGPVVDAQSDGEGNFWWSDSGESFSRLVLETGVQTTWALTNFESLSGVAVDQSGAVWFSEWFGSQSKLHRFDPAEDEWCSYTYPGVGYSYFILNDGQSFWSLNWFSKDIVRFSPASMTSVRWEMAGPVDEPYALAIGGDGVLWWSDRSNHIFNLDPATDQQTVYTLPSGTGAAVERLEVGKGLIWYTESISGTMGALDPFAAASTTTTLAATIGAASASCSQLMPLPELPATNSTGALSGSSIPVSTLQENEGWFVYALPEKSELQGLVTAGGYRWVTDMGRGKLVRLAFSDVGRLSIDLNARPTAAYHGQTITYTYRVSYTSTDNSPATHIVVSDTVCQNATFSSGDTNSNIMLDVGEVWLYECVMQVPEHDDNETGFIVNEATANGQNLDGIALAPARDTHGVEIIHERKPLFLPVIRRT